MPARSRAQPDDYTPTVRVRLEAGRYVLAEDYLRALRGRDVLRARGDGGARGARRAAAAGPGRAGHAARRRHGARGRRRRAGAQRHAAAHPAVQHHRPRRPSPCPAAPPAPACRSARSWPDGPRPGCCRGRHARTVDPRTGRGGPAPDVITPFFHRWEHRLASATKNRVVRPFEWGLDWLPPDRWAGWAGGAGRPGPGARSDDGARVERWVEEVMRDTHAFFTPPPTADFEFSPAPGEPRTARRARCASRARSPRLTPRTTSWPRAGFPAPPRSGPPATAAPSIEARSCWCCRSGTPTPAATSGWRGCSRASASPRCASACRTTTCACRPS